MINKIQFSKGIQFMMIATFAFAVMGALIKQVNNINVVQIIFFRSSISALMCTTTLLRARQPVIGRNQKLLILRSVLGLISMSLFFITLQRIPFGVSVTLRYLAPFFSIILAVWLLNEKASWQQWILFLLAIVGVFLLKGFDTRIDNVSLLYSILSALFAAGVYVTIKRIGTTEHPLVIVNYFMGLTAILSGIALFHYWEPVSYDIFGILILIGMVGFFGQKFMTLSLQAESLVNVAPFKYLELVYAFIIGYFIFDEGYSTLSLCGIGLVITSFMGNYILSQRLALKTTSPE